MESMNRQCAFETPRNLYPQAALIEICYQNARAASLASARLMWRNH
jgi:hypothetical protein